MMSGGTKQGQTDIIPELLTKKQVAEFLQCSQRQVELLAKQRRICQPLYIGKSSPRWKRSELLASLDNAIDSGPNAV